MTDRVSLGSDLGYWEMEIGRVMRDQKGAGEFSTAEWGNLYSALGRAIAALSAAPSGDSGAVGHPPGGLSVEDWARVVAAADGVTWNDGAVTYRSVGDENEPATARYYRMAQAILAAMEPRP